MGEGGWGGDFICIIIIHFVSFLRLTYPTFLFHLSLDNNLLTIYFRVALNSEVTKETSMTGYKRHMYSDIHLSYL